MKYIILTASLIILSSCSQYYAGSGTKQQFLEHRYACYQENIVNQSSFGGFLSKSGGGFSSQSSETCSDNGYTACMSAKGYTLLTPREKDRADFKLRPSELIFCEAP